MIRQSQLKTFTPFGTTWAVLLSGLLLMPPLTLEAQSVSKIGVINLAQAVETSVEGRKAAEQWTSRMTERSTEIQAKQQELVAAQQQVQTPEPGSSEAELLQLNRKVERLTTDLNRMTEDIDLELNALRQELLIPITEKVNLAIVDYAQENGFTLILDSSNPQGSLLFVQDAANITREIIRRVDAMSVEPPPPGPGPWLHR